MSSLSQYKMHFFRMGKRESTAKGKMQRLDLPVLPGFLCGRRYAFFSLQ